MKSGISVSWNRSLKF